MGKIREDNSVEEGKIIKVLRTQQQISATQQQISSLQATISNQIDTLKSLLDQSVSQLQQIDYPAIKEYEALYTKL